MSDDNYIDEMWMTFDEFPEELKRTMHETGGIVFNVCHMLRTMSVEDVVKCLEEEYRNAQIWYERFAENGFR